MNADGTVPSVGAAPVAAPSPGDTPGANRAAERGAPIAPPAVAAIELHIDRVVVPAGFGLRAEDVAALLEGELSRRLAATAERDPPGPRNARRVRCELRAPVAPGSAEWVAAIARAVVGEAWR